MLPQGYFITGCCNAIMPRRNQGLLHVFPVELHLDCLTTGRFMLWVMCLPNLTAHGSLLCEKVGADGSASINTLTRAILEVPTKFSAKRSEVFRLRSSKPHPTIDFEEN